ncbi:MAG: 2-C-methyl-D-erythritol 4-phosphate cytidylyltransferase [Actinobacteria bacterium]|nr:MAG: 2-C-methyl-D-erythritol 4-phosphate cytidylyltransferase [Actinomycetota bacterium]
MTTWTIVVAGGSGTRFGGPKHRQMLDGVELWQRSVDAFDAAGIEHIVVVGDVPGGIPGGSRRRDSVACGLGAVPDIADWVLIHDAARPLVTPQLIERVLARASMGDVDGVIPAVPVTDTLKRVQDEAVLATVDRNGLSTVQTPQAFRVPVLRAAHDSDITDATDDAGLVERADGTVVAVMGDPMNIKITNPGDLEIARVYLEVLRGHG